MAHIMCSTQQNDVRDAVKELKRRQMNGTLTQVGKRLYSHLDKNKGEAGATEGKRNHKYIINRATEVIHRDGCRALKQVKPTYKISAALVNIEATGLKTCGICM